LTSHNRTVWLKLALAKVFLSGLKAMERIQLVSLPTLHKASSRNRHILRLHYRTLSVKS
jgi:hypothetical protein